MNGWPCLFTIQATMPNGRSRKVEFIFDGAGTFESAISEFKRRIRKPSLWLGVQYMIVTPLGQTKLGIFEG